MELGEFLSQNSFVILMGIISGFSVWAVNGHRVKGLENNVMKLEMELSNAKNRDTLISERLIVIETKLEYIVGALDDLKKHKSYSRSRQ